LRPECDRKGEDLTEISKRRKEVFLTEQVEKIFYDAKNLANAEALPWKS
jgi:hypothetical protein